VNTFRSKRNLETFEVNVPMLYPNIEEIMKIIVGRRVKIVLLHEAARKTL
jgi:hypothetical protein